MDDEELAAFCAELAADPGRLERQAARKAALDAYLLCDEAERPARLRDLARACARVDRP